MYHIKPVYTEYEKKEYSKGCGFELSEDMLVVAAFDNNRFVGCCLCRQKDNCGEILEIGFIPEYNDRTIEILLLKGTLNVLDLKGVSEVYFYSSRKEILEDCGFSEKNGHPWVLLDGYFDEPCKSCKNKC